MWMMPLHLHVNQKSDYDMIYDISIGPVHFPVPYLVYAYLPKRSKFMFSEHGHVAYQIKWNHKYSNMVANILPTDPTPPQPWGSNCQILTFSEHGHVAYQIKGNHECSNMVANILPAEFILTL